MNDIPDDIARVVAIDKTGAFRTRDFRTLLGRPCEGQAKEAFDKVRRDITTMVVMVLLRRKGVDEYFVAYQASGPETAGG